MNPIITWSVLEALLKVMCHKFDESINSSKNSNCTNYYFLPGKERAKKPDEPTLGKAVIDANPEISKSIAEKAVYNYLYIPATKRRNKEFNNKSIYPQIFLKYIDCNELSDFLDLCEQKKLLKDYLIEEQRELLSLNAEKKEIFQYKFFYFDGRRIKLGKLEVENMKKATLLFQYNDSVKLTAYLGTVYFQNNIAYFSLNRQGENSHLSMSFYIGTEGFNRYTKLMQGTFSAADKDSTPIAGHAIIEYIEPDKEFDIKDTATHLNSTSPEILLHLSNRFIGTSNNLPRDYFNLINANVQRVCRLRGTYVSYTIDNENQCLARSIYKVNNDFTVLCKSKPTGFFSGAIKIYASGKIGVLTLKSNNSDAFFHVTLQLDSKKDNSVYEGVYSGISLHNFPESGREIFIKQEGTEFDQTEPSVIKLNKPAFKDLIKKHPFIESFFTNSFGRRYIEDISTIQKINSISKSREWLDKFKGVYLMYFRSSVDTIRKYVLHIKNDGSIKLKGNINYSGHYHVKANNLIINIQPGKYQEYFQQIIFYLGNRNEVDKLNDASGIFSGLSDSGAPISTRCILTRTQSLSYEKESNEDYNVSDLEGLSKKLPVPLSSYLIGKTDNVLISEKKSNDSNFQSNDYGELYFNSSCYLASQKETNEDNNTKVIIKQIVQAIEHGFNNASLLKKELSEGGYLHQYREFIKIYLMLKYENDIYIKPFIDKAFNTKQVPKAANIEHEEEKTVKVREVSA